MTSSELMGPGEVAEMFGVTSVTVSRWQSGGYLPPPDYTVKLGPLWWRGTLEQWAARVGRLTSA